MSLPKVETQKDPNYRTILTSGVFGGHRAGYFEAIIYTEELIADDALETAKISSDRAFIRRTQQCRLVMDPFQAKSFAEWLNRHIQEYEKKFGKIEMSEETKKEMKPAYG